MKKILFYDKQLAWNSPMYAVPLLQDLQKRGFEVTVLVSKPTNDLVADMTEKRLKINFEDIYEGFPTYRFDSFKSLFDLLNEFQPDIFLANFACYNIERKLYLKIASGRFLLALSHGKRIGIK